ncbi:protein kinase domain-containing protein [Nocardioides ungokensis]|uniref:protein kinase domain-containing protein n=1 Tax=Nocardioides ungokensis TaxID=1643322 RepID=UPI001FE96CA9|nr:protein kinase [Nocardioides ungokensis]
MTGRLLDGRYRIGPRIARGGMASVYEAVDLRLDRTVAVKVMHSGLGDDEEFAARFVREARAAARLSHPNVVGVYDQGQDDGTVYLAMELVPGHTLRDVIRKESPMPAPRALALLEPVLSALAAAHRAGLIHRDVKPENVLIATAPDSGATVIKWPTSAWRRRSAPTPSTPRPPAS